VLVISVAGCLLGTFLTKPEDDAVLKDFYRRVRPWGFWGPVLKMVLAEDPGFKRNETSCAICSISRRHRWQIALVVLPLYIVIKEFQRAAITLQWFWERPRFSSHLVRPPGRARGRN